MLKTVIAAFVLLSCSGAFALVSNDTALVQAIHQDQNVSFIEAGNMVVTQILPDDTVGLPHQRWMVRLSDNSTMALIYNSDMGDRVPLQVGESVAAGGQLIMGEQGPLLHWLHSDPKGRRPDGYIYANGVYYGGK